MSLSLRQWVVLAAALFLLNAAFSFHNVWPTLWIELWPEVSVEAALVVLALAAWRRFRGEPSDRLLVVFAAVLFVMTVGRYMEVTAPALYGRAINLYWDARYLPDVAAMFTASASWLAIAAIVLGALAFCALLIFVLFRVLAVVSDALAVRKSAAPMKALAALLVAAYFLGYYASLPTLGWFSIPVAQTYMRQVGFVMDALAGPDALAALAETEPLAGITAETLPDTDVLITFVESYGAVAYDDPALDAALAAPRAAFGDAIAASGRSVVSAFVSAPTTGGGSWLSHISFMSGLPIDSAALYDALLTRSRPTLPKLFDAAGFRTVALMPGLKNEWPEGAFYGFDEILGTAEVDYRGPEFGWWQIPDQFALARLDAAELAPANRDPVFVFFPTISTHAPFRPTPPYQPDWRRLFSASPYDTADLAAIGLPMPSLEELKPAYGDALAYTYAYWGGYLGETRDRDYLLVLVGDHQPPATVAGAGARWDVPVHVITRDRDLLERLEAAGFVAGLTPRPPPVDALRDLGLMLFR